MRRDRWIDRGIGAFLVPVLAAAGAFAVLASRRGAGPRVPPPGASSAPGTAPGAPGASVTDPHQAQNALGPIASGQPLSWRVTLTPRQANHVRDVTQLFRAAGLPDNAIAGAIANAWHESGTVSPVDGARGLNERAVGDNGASVGIWQMHERGAGRGMTVEQRMDVPTATSVMLRDEVLARAGNVFRDRARQGASVADLAIIFGRDIERPADRTVATLTRDRVGAAERLWGSIVHQAVPVQIVI